MMVLALPTAPRQLGSALQEWHYRLTPGADTVHERVHCPVPPVTVAVHDRSCTAHCPGTMRQCIAGLALPTVPRQCDSASRSCTAQCPEAVR